MYFGKLRVILQAIQVKAPSMGKRSKIILKRLSIERTWSWSQCSYVAVNLRSKWQWLADIWRSVDFYTDSCACPSLTSNFAFAFKVIRRSIVWALVILSSWCCARVSKCSCNDLRSWDWRRPRKFWFNTHWVKLHNGLSSEVYSHNSRSPLQRLLNSKGRFDVGWH